jgi:Zc3h12a-like Ribonuclease NYN domain/S1 RNA binding domain
MQADMPMKHVVIDGSNIATEGRDTPSLAQLDEAVRSFIEEYAPEIVTVVVDATFPNRIGAEERRIYEDAVAANELITPPAGAIGRGDAFVLQIARKADAAILSNDSFQEFHGDYPWLFEPGRLIGGKPVPHVGWVFMERVPVRGPASRRSVSEARKAIKATKATRASKPTVAPKAAEVPTPVETGTAKRRRPDGGATRDGATGEPAGRPASAAVGVSDDGQDDSTANRAAKDVSPYNEALPFIEFIADHPVGSEVEATVERFSSHGAYVLSGDARGYVPLRNLGDPSPRSAREVLDVGEKRRFVVMAIDAPRRGIDLALPGVADVPAGSGPPVEEQVVEALGMMDPSAPAEVAGAGTAEAAARKASTKRAATRKAAAKVSTVGERTTRKAAAKATTAREPAIKSSAQKAAKKATAKKAVPKKAPNKTATSKKAAPRKGAAKAATVKKAAKAGTARKAATPR